MEIELERGIDLDLVGPEKIMVLWDPVLKVKSFLVIDNSLYGIPVGGIRMAADLTLEEVAQVARAMTLKFCSFKIPLGGAKAGIIADPRDEGKSEKIYSLGESIKAFIKGDAFYPEPGLGTYNQETKEILKIMGKPEIIPRGIGVIKQERPLDKKYNGISAKYALKTILENIGKHKILKSKKEWNSSPTVLLEGFGRAGATFAKRAESLDMNILGIVTIEGGIFDEDGLDVGELLELKKEHGDKLVDHYESKNLVKVENDKFFNLSIDYSVDIIITGSRTDVINESNIDEIETNVIIPTSYSPYQKGIVDTLFEKEILAYPDFISNAGDILAIDSEQKRNIGLTEEQFINKKVCEKTREILKNSEKLKVIPYNYAKEKALNEFESKRGRRKKHIEKIKKTMQYNF